MSRYGRGGWWFRLFTGLLGFVFLLFILPSNTLNNKSKAKDSPSLFDNAIRNIVVVNDTKYNIVPGNFSANCTVNLNKTLDIFSRFTNSFNRINSTGEITSLLKKIKTSLDILDEQCNFSNYTGANNSNESKIFNDMDCKGYLDKIGGLNNLLLLDRNDEVGIMALLQKIKNIVHPGISRCEELYLKAKDDANVQLILGKMGILKFKNRSGNSLFARK